MKEKPVFTSLDVTLTAQRIHSVMLAYGYSVREIQEILHLSCPQSVYRWIRGYALPSVDNLYMLSKLFEMHMEHLLVERSAGNKAGKTE